MDEQIIRSDALIKAQKEQAKQVKFECPDKEEGSDEKSKSDEEKEKLDDNEEKDEKGRHKFPPNKHTESAVLDLGKMFGDENESPKTKVKTLLDIRKDSIDEEYKEDPYLVE